jgi:hypothetical protein
VTLNVTTDWVAAKSGALEAVAYHDLAHRPGFKLALHVARGRSYLYVAHLWHPGWSVLDVTDPAHPKLVNFLSGPDNTWTLQVTAHDGLLATSLEPIQDGWGGDSNGTFEEGVILWDLSDPTAPRRRGTFRTGYRGTHRNLFDSSGLLHLSARMPGYNGAILVLIDISDPDFPTEVGRFHMQGQHTEAGEHSNREWFDLHGPSMRQGDLAYLPYAGAGLVIVDVSSPARPTLVGHLDVHPPLGSGIAAHTVVPLRRRRLALLNSEALAERCQESVGYAGVVDVRDPTAPSLISLFPGPLPPPEADYTSFCSRGGRFGPHNQHMPTGDPHLIEDENVCFLTYFNAGLRVFDISDEYHVREVGYLIPKDPEKRYGPLPQDLIVQVEDVLVDSRGIVYFTEKNSGLYVAEWRGL